MRPLFEATHLRGFTWIVRPYGASGTIGWSPVVWEAIRVTRCKTAEGAIEKAYRATGSAWMEELRSRAA